ncbi:MAG: glycosyltransferase [Phycisphaerae bacterium]|nr:glycosyltransferase [Phycisphaerae bacterium]
MSVLFPILSGFTTFILIVWILRFIVLSQLNRILKPLDASMYADAEGELPRMSMIVAAKDEEANIEPCLRSLAAQDYPNLQIVAVNDRSTDSTGAIMDRLSGEFLNLRVHHVHALRPGWFGKNNAMREGVEMAEGDWLCFTDADCVQTSPRSVSIALRYAIEKNADFISVLPSHEAHGFWERVVQPACSAVMILWFSPLVVNNPKRKTAYANGAFMLMKQSCYRAIGGHEAVRDQINEDMVMARRAKECGQRLVVVGNRDLYTVRMYGTLAQTWRGWTRIFCGSFNSVARLWAAVIVLATFTFTPWVSLAFAVISDGLLVERADLESLKYISITACAMQLATMALFYSISRVRFFYGLVYPIGALLSMGTLLNAIRCASGMGEIRWRGTTYRDGEIAPETSAA